MNEFDSWRPDWRSIFAKKPIAMLCLFALLLQLLMLTAEAPRAAAYTIGEDMLQNGGFEQSSDGKPHPWLAMGGWNNPDISLTPAAARSGTGGVRIETNQATNPWIAQDVLIEPGAVYDVSVWLKSSGVTGSGIGVKFEYYKGQTRAPANRLSQYDMTKNIAARDLTGEWQNLRFQFTVPPEAGLVLFYLRMYGAGTVHFDDVSFVLTKQRPMIDVATDQIFYYSGAEEGKVEAVFYSPDVPLDQLHAEASLSRQSTGVVLATYAHANAAQPMSFPFDPTLMVEEEPYRVEVRLLNDANTVLETVAKSVYRIDRPTMLREDGTVMADGEPFFPVAAYHVRPTDYPSLAEAGINTVQGVVTNNADTLQSALDAAEQSGLKVMVPLYYNMMVKENASLTEQFVTRFKSHPAVLAWMIMDEPFSNGKTLEELAEAYRLIRSIDKAHPTYMVEALPPYYATTAKATDILVTDVYTIPYAPVSLVGERTALAKQAAGGKPVWNVLQAMYNPPNWPILPTIGELRNAAYQSMLNGLQGLAYYAINENTFQLRNSELWPGMVDFREELELFDRLATEGSLIGQGETDDGRWAVWEHEHTLYAAAVNTSEENRQMTMPLGVTGYRAQLLHGDSRSVLDGQSDELNVNLGPLQSLMYRVTPYRDLISEALGVVTEASALSTDAQWTSRMSQLGTKLNAIRDNLNSVAPDFDAAVQSAIHSLKKVDQLSDWAEQNGSGAAKQEMLTALAQIRENAGPLAASYAQSELHVEGGTLIGQEEWNELSFALSNEAESSLQNVRVTLEFPASFDLEPMTRQISPLGSGQAAAEAFGFRIAEPLSQKSYRLKAVIGFEYSDYPGIPISVETFIDSPYTDLLDAVTEPEVIQANKGGSYPFAVRVESNVPKNVQIELESVSESGMTVQLPAPFLLPGKQQATVNGTVYLPTSVTDGVYEAEIRVKADGKLVRSMPLRADVDKNRLGNPGFEQANVQGTGPAGWMMRKGTWVQDAVYGGLYAVSLPPDAANAWNVINSDLLAIDSGVKHVLKGWVKNGSSAGNVSIGLRQVRENGTSTIGYAWKAIMPDSEWTYYELEITPASTAKFLQVYLLSDTLVNGTAWFDDLYVGEIAID